MQPGNLHRLALLFKSCCGICDVCYIYMYKLKDQQLSFYTYAENDVKTKMFVLKRHHFVTPAFNIIEKSQHPSNKS